MLSWSLSVEHRAAHSVRQPFNPSSALAWSLHDPHGPAPVESEARGLGQINRELSAGGIHRHQPWVFLIIKLFHQCFGFPTLQIEGFAAIIKSNIHSCHLSSQAMDPHFSRWWQLKRVKSNKSDGKKNRGGPPKTMAPSGPPIFHCVR